jgi:mannose-6-phosphate isomerase-like protein (cupin superfamily)
MSIKIRRVVTGHDDQGRAKVLVDEQVKNVFSHRPGAHYSVIWSSQGFPVNNDGNADPSGKSIGTAIDNGTVFRVVSFGPGVAPRNHRTDSIDYAAVISGEIDMELDVETVHLTAGDVLVQRGTIHNWVNKGKVPCVIAFTLISAKPVTAGGTTQSQAQVPSSIAGILQQAQQHYDRALAAQRAGNWAEYGREIDALGAVLKQLREKQ